MGIFEMKDHALDGLDAALLTTETNSAMVGLITALLRDNNILYILREGNLDGYRKVMSGYMPSSTGIYVKREDLERANGLLDAFVRGAGAADE